MADGRRPAKLRSPLDYLWGTSALMRWIAASIHQRVLSPAFSRALDRAGSASSACRASPATALSRRFSSGDRIGNLFFRFRVNAIYPALMCYPYVALGVGQKLDLRRQRGSPEMRHDGGLRSPMPRQDIDSRRGGLPCAKYGAVSSKPQPIRSSTDHLGRNRGGLPFVFSPGTQGSVRLTGNCPDFAASVLGRITHYCGIVGNDLRTQGVRGGSKGQD